MANNGHEGLEKFKASRFDIIITDRAMPDISGDQLASAIKQITPEVPFIMITGFGSIMEANGDIPKDIDYLLKKPITLDTFRDAIASV